MAKRADLRSRWLGLLWALAPRSMDRRENRLAMDAARAERLVAK